MYLQHTPHGIPKLLIWLRLLNETLLGSKWYTKVEYLDGVHYADLQFMPHGTLNLLRCLGMLGGAQSGSEGGAEVVGLGEVSCKGLWLMPLSVGGSSATWSHWVRSSQEPSNLPRPLAVWGY